MQRLRYLTLAFAMLAVASFAVSAMAQEEDSNGPPPRDEGGPGGPQGGPRGPRGAGGPGGGFHLLPRFAVEDLKLTADQKKQVADLEKDTKAKLYKILTSSQKKTLEQARPPRDGQGGPGGGGGQGRGRRGPGGPGRGGPGGPGGGPEGGPGGPEGPGGDSAKPDNSF